MVELLFYRIFYPPDDMHKIAMRCFSGQIYQRILRFRRNNLFLFVVIGTCRRADNQSRMI